MQNGNDKNWKDILNEIKELKLKAFELTEENAKLEAENVQLKERLGIAEAYRFCDKPSIIIK